MEITFELKIPDKSLSPNSRSHWRVKQPHKVASREEAETKAIAFISSWEADNGEWVPTDKATVQANFCFKDNRRRDKDNFGAMLKSVWDGLTRGGLWKDDSGITHLPVLFTTGVKNPRVEITVYTDGSLPTGLSHKPVEDGDI